MPAPTWIVQRVASLCLCATTARSRGGSDKTSVESPVCFAVSVNDAGGCWCLVAHVLLSESVEPREPLHRHPAHVLHQHTQVEDYATMQAVGCSRLSEVFFHLGQLQASPAAALVEQASLEGSLQLTTTNQPITHSLTTDQQHHQPSTNASSHCAYSTFPRRHSIVPSAATEQPLRC